MGESMWWLMDIILPGVLLVGLIWLVMCRKSNRTDQRTERGTAELYEEEERRRREGTDDL